MAIPGGQVTAPSPEAEFLGSFMDAGNKRRQPGDGTEPGGTGSQGHVGRVASPTQTPDELATQDQSGLTPDGPTLMDATPDQLFKTIEQLVRSQDRLARNRWAIDLHYDSIRCGIPFSRLEKIPNINQWVQKFPSGFNKQSFAATPNKADDLCNKIEDTLMADPPKPDPTRHVNDEAVREAAELASQILLDDGGEAGTNDNETYRWALNNAFSRSASILHYRVDDTGGGYQPLQKLAHPLATDPNNPMVGQIPQPPDPLTGQPMPPIPEVAVNPILRYVSADNQFVEDATQADKVWLPKIIVERLRREQVRCIPYNAPVERADAVILIRWMTLADARKEWPETVGQMDDKALAALANWRPAMAETMIIPYAFMGLSGGGSGPSVDQVGSLSPLLTKRIYAYRIYVKKSPEYPEGFWADVNQNAKMTLGAGTLEYVVSVPNQGKVTRCRQIPCVQIRPMQDVSGGDAMGWPLISRFAGGSEANATLYAAFADLCDNMLHPHVFIRSVTAVDEDDWADRTTPIILGPQDPEPSYESFPTLPPVMEFLDRNNTAMDTSSGLGATAQGLEVPTSVSGISKQLTIQRAQVALSGFQQNLHAGMTRGWNIKCELIQSAFTIPQLLTYSGEDASSEPQWWTGEDFAGIDQIGIQPGTGTMMTPEGKAQYVAFLQSQQWLTQDQASDVALPGIRMDLGIPENPVQSWLERCVSAWLMGPTPAWVQESEQQAQTLASQQQQVQTAQQAYTAQAQQNQLHGIATLPFTPPQFQPMNPLPTPFPSLPTLTEIPVAQAVVKRLNALMFDPRYADTQKYPSAWQKLVTDVYAQARQAQIPPPPPAKVDIKGVAADAPTLEAEEAASKAGWQGQPPPPNNAVAPRGPSPVAPPIARLVG